MAPRLAGLVRHLAFALVLPAAAMGPLAPTIESTLALRLIVQTFFVLAAALWLVSMSLEGRIRLRRTGIGPWFILFAGTVIAAVVNAGYRHPAFLTAFLWLSNMVAFLFIINVARTQRARLLLLAAISASALVVALHGIHQHEVTLPDALKEISLDPVAVARSLNLPPSMTYDLVGRVSSMRVFSTFVLPNSLAGFLTLVLPACLGLFLDRHRRSEDRREKRFSLLMGGVLLLPMLVAFYFTKSKGAALALLVAMAAFVLWAFGKKLLRKYPTQILGVLASLAIIVAVAQTSGLLPPVRDYAGSLAVRAGYWRACTTMIKERPFVGVGLDNFADAYSAMKRAQDQEARRAHNDYIQIAAEIGVNGLLVYVAAWVAFWRRVRRRGAEPALPVPERPLPRPLLLAAILALGGFVFLLAVHCGGSLRSSKEGFGMAWPFMLCAAWVGFMILFVFAGKTPGPVRNSYATIGVACGLIGFLVHSSLDFDHYVAGIFQTAWIFMAVLLAARMSEEKETYLLDKPIGTLPRLAIIIAASAAALFCSQGFVLPVADAQAFRERATDFETKLTLKDRQELLENAIAVYPWDAQNYALLSDLLLSRNQPGPSGESATSQAISRIEQAIKLNANRSEYHTRLGRLHEMRWRRNRPQNPADYHKALAAYLRAEDLFPSSPDTALNLGRIRDLGRWQQAALGKYLRALRLSEEQYHIPRKLKRKEIEELKARVATLSKYITARKLAPPPRFTEPRLWGVPPFARPIQPALPARAHHDR